MGESRRWTPWRSVRTRAIGAVLLALCLPLVWVWSGGLVDTGNLNLVKAELRAAVESAVVAERPGLLVDAVPESDPVRLAAWQHSVRLRRVDRDGTVLEDVNWDSPKRWYHRVAALFYGPGGRPDAAEWDAAQPDVADRSEVLEAWSAGRASGCVVAEEGLLMVCHEARVDGDELWYATRSSTRLIRTLYEDRFQLLALTLNAGVLALILGWFLSWRLVTPIETLRREALDRTRSHRATAPLPLADRADEFGDLARAFNALLEDLEQRNAANEAFAADLAHELKNPVAAIRTASDTLGSGRPVDEKRAQRLHRILADSTERLQTVVDRFLELARAESGLTHSVREMVDFGALVRALSASEAASHPEVDWRCEIEDAAVHAAPERLETAVRNLLANAASFAAGEQPWVSVRVRVSSREVVLTVEDSGPGIEQEDLPRVFDRYFSKRQGGTGLGLPLARAIAAAHGGSLVAESPAGARFVLTLPRA